MERTEQQNTTGADTPGLDPIQGEGDYRAAREYREDVQQFLQHADVEKAARDAAPRDRSEARELERAEAQGRSRARYDPESEDMSSTRLSSERMRQAARSLGRAVQQRPVIAIIVVGALGYLLGRIRLRSSIA
ncbi:MAG TPA: hypothetical protein VNH41_08840 [Steroidobacteraceae bacterium]|jgi:pyruvate/2-oxoglutarate dehydrogenase complex dihydrolipoamide acyltransferase (E2) component|nr:hypothetical protein [Steroidobacteraceae bacterium]